MKMILDYEVEGSWSVKKSKHKSRCRVCGALLKEVPQEGHFNSRYWHLKRTPDEILVCCPKGCKVETAERIMKEYLAVRHYCIEGSESYKFSLDFDRIKHAWIDREGKIYPCELYGHILLAEDLGYDEVHFEQTGWLKLSQLNLIWEKRLNESQIQIAKQFIDKYRPKDCERLYEMLERSKNFLELK